MTLLATHVGSLPRSQPVVDYLFARERGETYDPAGFDACMADHVAMLVKRQEGELLLERPPSAPTYTLTESGLEKTQLYMWQVAPEVRDRIDAERLRMGNIAVAAYLIHLVNDWLGQPMGLRLRTGSQS